MRQPLSKAIRLALVSAFCLAALPAGAVVLLPGDNLALPGTTVAAEPQLAGLIIVDDLIAFSFSGGTITGEVQERIVRSTVDGTLDFYWRIINDATSTGAVGSLRLGNFVSPEYNANYRIDGVGDIGPDRAHRFTPNDTFVNFIFTDGVAPGDSSNFFFLDTTATNYAPTARFDLTDTGVGPISGEFLAYSPAPEVPEPGTIGLVGVGVALVAWRRHRLTT
jgi:PEP-CTERM motif-containing protein